MLKQCRLVAELRGSRVWKGFAEKVLLGGGPTQPAKLVGGNANTGSRIASSALLFSYAYLCNKYCTHSLFAVCTSLLPSAV
jgi:hypothetical protein